MPLLHWLKRPAVRGGLQGYDPNSHIVRVKQLTVEVHVVQTRAAGEPVRQLAPDQRPRCK